MIDSDGLPVVVLHGGHNCDPRSCIASNAICADLDHSNEELRGALKEWLSWLRNEIGFMGWRFDFVKGSVTCAPTLAHALRHISCRQQMVQCCVQSVSDQLVVLNWKAAAVATLLGVIWHCW